jgi:hypothetical protein
MNLSLVLVSCWLYLGRAVLFGLLAATGIPNQKVWSTALAITTGLLIAPLVLAVFSYFSFAFQAVFVVLLLVDLYLFYVLLRHQNFIRLFTQNRFLAILFFGFIVMMLSWLNGPLIEHLSDAWWHMRNVSFIVNGESLIFPKIQNDYGFLQNLLLIIGADSSSYRMQGFVAWLTNSSILDTWIATSTAVSGLLGISIFLLFYHLPLNRLALFFSLLYWLILLGGMNTGVRLSGWPAGMGYVFLNLGLIACYQLFCDMRSSKAWALFGVSILGTVLFHYSELFLLLFAIASLLGLRLLFGHHSIVKSVAILALLSVTLFVLFRQSPTGKLATGPAFIESAVLLLSVWIIGFFTHRLNPKLFFFFSSLICAAVAYFIIDWHHLLSLFHPDADASKDYYSSYIPHYKNSWGGRFYIVSKWEHQLRASVLWAGVISLFLAPWLAWKFKDGLSRWLLILMAVPWLILVSPALFTMISSFVPIYGTYRVQLLMPIAIVLGVVSSYAIRGFSTQCNSPEKSLSEAKLLGLRLPANAVTFDFVKVCSITIIALIAYYLFVKTLNNFIDYRAPHWLGVCILATGVGFAVFKIPVRIFLNTVLLTISVLVVVPDAVVRLGLINERPWAVHSNLAFHWRLTNAQEAIKTHSSWRYQKDITSIRDITSTVKNSGFLSDIATSYYVAAETELEPLVQQAHHSTSGLRYNKLVKSFCDNTITVFEFSQKISRINIQRKKSRSDKVRFLIFNGDTLNYTAEVLGTSCVGQTKQFEFKLAEVADRIYKGDYLSLWELHN